MVVPISTWWRGVLAQGQDMLIPMSTAHLLTQQVCGHGGCALLQAACCLRPPQASLCGGRPFQPSLSP
jgi:hypothetical protein